MAEVATRGLPPVSPGLPLPVELVVWEILVRLPPKSLLRCRLVCRSWRRLTSTLDFLLAHHRRQPSLPLIAACKYDEFYLVDILTLDRRGAAARLDPVARYYSGADYVDSCCDGLLFLSWNTGPPQYSICNPTTRQYGDLPLISGFIFMGLYQHRPTGDHRILLYRSEKMVFEDLIPGNYVYTLGSNDMPRRIGWAEVSKVGSRPVLLRGSLLHWYKSTENMILVFDTTAESFRWMRTPIDKTTKNKLDREDQEDLFEMDCTLGMYCCKYDMTIVNIWVLQDYEQEVFSEDGDDVVLVECGRWVLCIDTDGKLLASLQHDV
uniref:F-box domain-containing protein n=1 Tax=Oryza punctata TaxID=4537 RepID=A0A0E0KN15_ORYPU